MYKRIFFGKIPKELVNVRDSGRYITITMAVLAGVTLIIGVYPAPLLTPITTYVQGMFHNTPGVVPLPQFQNSQGIVPLPQPGGSGHAVPVAKNIVFKSGYGLNSNAVFNSVAAGTSNNGGGSNTYLEMKSEHMVGLRNG
jgi:NADH-quinone oxidoreductase subunit M